MRIALDSNLLVYAEGVNGADRQRAALTALKGIEAHEIVIPVQVLAELFTVLTRKARMPVEDARTVVLSWADAYDAIDTSFATLIDAMELVASHRLASWDAIILSASADAGCRFLLSEDMHDGFTWRGATVRNPFAGGFRIS